MYDILRKEITGSSLSIAKLAVQIGVTEKTLRNKISGKTEFTWPEVLQIRDIVSPKGTLEELFQKDFK